MTGRPNPERIEEIFDLLRKQPDAAERSAYLDVLCRDDSALRALLEKLLAAHFNQPGFLPKVNGLDAARDVAGTSPADTPAPDIPVAVIGPFRLLEKLGEGGFGEVWMAQQREPVRRRVAIKLIKPGMDSKLVVARFDAERQALAMMDHPNIAKILDAGTTGSGTEGSNGGTFRSPASGRPYFVMELVRGSRITEYCDRHHLATVDRIRLFILVCNAVQHAHQKGIIHRDLKPSNILVAMQDGVPMPKVIDFGIAKAMQQDLTDQTLFTHFAQFIGTPAYISPEQANLGSEDIDTRSDIYSLGVLLYELLVGRTPFDPAEMVKGGIDSLRQVIRTKEPVRPSTRLKKLPGDDQTVVAQQRRSEPIKLGRQLSGDLDWIVLKCLEKDRARRYETANALAMELQRYLANEPIVARPPSTAYRVQKAWQRNKALFVAGFAIALVLLSAAVVSTWQAAQARKARNAVQALLYVAQMNQMGDAWAANDPGRIRQLLEETADFPDRGFEWHYWQRLAHLDVRTLRGHAGRVWSANFSPDGRRVVTGSDDGTAKVWDVATGQSVLTLPGHGDWVRSVAFSPNGSRIATASKDFIVRIWDAATGTEIRRMPGHRGPIRTVAFDRSGGRLVTACQDGTAQTWDAETGRALVTFRGHSNWVFSAAFAPDGRRLVTSGDDATARIWDTESGRELLRLEGHVGNVRTAVFSPDGREVVTAGQDRTARIWDSGSGRLQQTLAGHPLNVLSAAYSPDGRHVVTSSADQTARIWDVATGREVNQFKGHDLEVYTACFSPDGRQILTASEDGTSRIWDVSVASAADVIPYGQKVYSVAISPDAQEIAVGGEGGRIQLWSATTGELLLSLSSHETEVRSLAFSPDGDHLAAGHGDGNVRIWQLRHRQLWQTLGGHLGGVNSVSFSPDGTWILTAGGEGQIKLRRTADGRELLSIPPKYREAFSARFSPDASRLIGAFESAVVVYRTDGGSEMLTLPNVFRVRSASFSPESRWILAASNEKSALRWNAHTGEPASPLVGHTRVVYAANYSPDGKRIVTASQDRTARIWEADTGRELLSLQGHTAEVSSAVFSPDGRRVVTGSLDGTALVWNAASRQQQSNWQRERDGGSDRQRGPRPDSLAKNRGEYQPAGLVPRWLLLAPLPMTNDDVLAALDSELLPGEAQLRPHPRQTVSVNGRSFSWEPVEQGPAILDFNSLVGRAVSPKSVAYAVCYLVAEAHHSGVVLKIISDDESKLYLNGRLLHRSNPQRSYVLEEGTVDGVELPAGTNTVVFKIVNDLEFWRGSVRVLDARGQELPKLRVILDPRP